MGYQIAFQTAFYGFNVTVYDINDEVLEKAKAKFDILAESYKKDLKATEEQLAATKANLQYNSNLAEAVQDADLLIEAVPENPQIKIGFYEQLAKVAPAKTVFATNSSTMLPSQFAEYTFEVFHCNLKARAKLSKIGYYLKSFHRNFAESSLIWV